MKKNQRNAKIPRNHFFDNISFLLNKSWLLMLGKKQIIEDCNIFIIYTLKLFKGKAEEYCLSSQPALIRCSNKNFQNDC